MSTENKNPITHSPQTPAEIPTAVSAMIEMRKHRREIIGWWFKFFFQPLIAVATLILIVFAFGLAQRFGMFTSVENTTDPSAESTEDQQLLYICPMVCVPPSTEPGRCPVCGMNLEAKKVSGDSKDIYGLNIDPASIRIADIRTVTAKSEPLFREFKTIGKISYDESSLATISAYVDGRIDKLIADFTGVAVDAGDELAIFYSPDLYTSQVALLESSKLLKQSTKSSPRIQDSNKRLYQSSRQRLIELGLTENQVRQLERDEVADSRIHIVSPITGTVIERMAVEGQYLKTGQPIYKLADLSTVWLMLELFPQDAAAVRLNQKVVAKIESLPGIEFTGHVAFIAPIVNTKTQTVQVRVVISNEQDLIRVGDLASATIIVNPDSQANVVVVPREAVLMAGAESVAYVETKPGRFEIRSVEIGQIVGEKVSILSGIQAGERVVAAATLLIDSQFNMDGKPSLIDPARAKQTQKKIKMSTSESPETQSFNDDDLPKMNLPKMNLPQMQLPEMKLPQMDK